MAESFGLDAAIGAVGAAAMLAAGGVDAVVTAAIRAENALSSVTTESNPALPFPKPEGVPDDWIESPSLKNDGTRYTDPNNSGNEVRIMPGDPSSPWPNSQAPYVRWTSNGQSLDVSGNPVPVKTPDAHIPLTNFKFNPKVYE